MLDQRHRRVLAWASAGVLAGGVTAWAMFREVTTFGRPEGLQTGLDFSNNTWRAVRSLLGGANIYGPTHAIIPDIGPAWPVSQHVPASLLWQAPFAALPLREALFAFTFASICAIWAAVFLISSPRRPEEVLIASLCGAFAVCFGGGPETLILGQPTAFALLGMAILLRARQPWLGAVGLTLLASTLQTGVPFILALLVLGGWPTVWRGACLITACSLPVVSLEVVNSGALTFATTFVSGATVHLERLSDRIDLPAFMQRLGLTSLGLQITAGIAVGVIALAFLTRLPPHRRRLGYPPVLCVVIAFTLLCTYHQPYDMLLVGGGIVPVILVRDRPRDLLPAFGLAGVSAALSTYRAGLLIDSAGVLALGLCAAFAARRAAGADPLPERARAWSGETATEVIDLVAQVTPG